MKRLIVTADDFGYSEERNRGIIESFQKGIVTNTSLLVNATHTQDAVNQAKKSGIPFKYIGLHLNLTEGRPLSQPSEIPSLLDNQGIFLGKPGFHDAVDKGTIYMKEVKVEMRKQIEKFKNITGEIPIYVDGHQHAHVTDIRESYSEVLAEYGIRYTRQCGEINMEKMDHIQPEWRPFFIRKAEEAFKSIPVYQRHGIWNPDCFVGLSTMGSNMTVERLKSFILTAFQSCSKGGNSVCELMVHPGYRTKGDGGCGCGPDDFTQSPDREHELEIMTGDELKNFLKEADIELVSYCDVKPDF